MACVFFLFLAANTSYAVKNRHARALILPGLDIPPPVAVLGFRCATVMAFMALCLDSLMNDV